MSRNKTPAPAYEPGTQYRVELAARLDLHGQTFYPGAELTLRGDVLAGVDPAAVASATPLDAAN